MKIGFFSLLFLLFLTLKLTHSVDWSWVWVTAPLWGSALFVLAFMLLFAIIAVVAAASGAKVNITREK